jgi:hypothetical protein
VVVIQLALQQQQHQQPTAIRIKNGEVIFF